MVRPGTKIENATTAKVTEIALSRCGRPAGKPRARASASAPRKPGPG